MSVNTVYADSNDYTSQYFSHFSDWYRLMRAIAWFLKFKGILKTLMEERKELYHTLRCNTSVDSELEREMKNFKTSLSGGTLTVTDIKNAEKEIICYS